MLAKACPVTRILGNGKAGREPLVNIGVVGRSCSATALIELWQKSEYSL